MKKIFIVSGEVSGDSIAAWYVQRLRKQNPNIVVHAVGGPALEAEGVELYARMEDLNVVGLVEILKKLPFILRFSKQLMQHILDGRYDEVVLVDFPGFNLRLARMLKKQNKNMHITYVSPPQLWAWGAWRLKKIKRSIDRVIVMYPFEVDWYSKRGLKVEWLGSPVYQRLEAHLQQKPQREFKIALLPGSRHNELAVLLPLMIKIATRLSLAHPGLRFVLPLASTFRVDQMKKMIRQAGGSVLGERVKVVADRAEKYRHLSTCCLALAKPGTTTLELALLGIPTLLVFKTSWLTYLLARGFVRVEWMGLPNLLLGRVVYPEFIQFDCTQNKILAEANTMLRAFKSDAPEYHVILEDLAAIRQMLES